MSLDFETLQRYLQKSPALRLLRSEHAAFIVSFLYDQFKNPAKLVIAADELEGQLREYLYMLNEKHPDAYPRSAGEYLSTWCGPEHQFLRHFHEAGTGEPVYELTPDTEQVVLWMEELEKDSFVGTESRFMQIFQWLQEMVEQATAEPGERLEQLKAKRAKIDAEIERIEQTGQVDTYSPVQLQERFSLVDREALRLAADFKSIEKGFREITRQVREQQLTRDVTKGKVLDHVISADRALQESEQGQSFYAFWRFLMSSNRQEKLDQLIEEVYALDALDEAARENTQLWRLKNNLIQAGVRVIDSNRRLIEQLRRMFDEAHVREHRRVLNLADDIKRLAADLKKDPPKQKAFFAIEAAPSVHLPLERPLWRPSPEPVFRKEPALAENKLSAVDTDKLFDAAAVDEEELRERIDAVLADKEKVELPELLEQYPARKGLAELLYYLKIAGQESGHRVNTASRQTVTIPAAEDREEAVSFAMPQITFVR